MSDEPVSVGAILFRVIPVKAGIHILDHPVKSQRDPADRMMTVGTNEIAAPSLRDGSQ